MMKRIVCSFLVVIFLLMPFLNCTVFASSNSEKALSVAEEIINWKKADNGSSKDGYLINNTFLELAGSTPGDWFPIGLGRLNISDNYEGYLAVVKERVKERYQEPRKLSVAKSTEWHRISLAVLSMGGDPTSFGKDENGNEINLIADGTYNRGKTTPLGRQGINGWIWGLIALDSMRYEVPNGAYYTREDIILEILSQQLKDGGFALSGNDADADMTAMALQALSPYYNSEKIYTYTKKSDNKKNSKTVRQVVDEALDCLSKLQLNTGDYKSWGTENVESTNQVAVALCSLGIDPFLDARFIKNGKTVFDGILRYKMKDGGFVHSFTFDSQNPTAVPNKSNTMASEQTLYTMAALWRSENGMRTLYDFRPEQSKALKKRISDLINEISKLNKNTDVSVLKNLLISYYSIPQEERSYVNNYWTLSDIAKKSNIDVEEIAKTTAVVKSPDDDESVSLTLSFTESDRMQVNSLPEKLTTEQYVTVITLLDKIKHSKAFDEKEKYIEKLITAQSEISKIQAEIDSINLEILNKLYPFNSITLKDKKTIDTVVKRYKQLSEYDKTKIEHWEDVIKAKTKIDNQLRGIVISLVLMCVTIAMIIFLILRIRKKHHKKQIELEDLSKQFSDEDNN